MMKIELNHTYLVEYKHGSVLSSVTILRVSDKAYNVRWNVDSPNTQWYMKKKFEQDYTLVEDITELMNEIPLVQPDLQLKIDFPELKYAPDYVSPKSTTEWEVCPHCGGTGQIPSDGMTSIMYQTCPLCNGAKMIVKRIVTQ